jgi:hypothetical protein
MNGLERLSSGATLWAGEFCYRPKIWLYIQGMLSFPFGQMARVVVPLGQAQFGVRVG